MEASTTKPPAPGEGADAAHSRADEIRQGYGAELAALGLDVSRAGTTVDASTPGYVADGRHLAVYVTPLSSADSSPEGYARRIVPLTELFVGRVFAEHPEIQSFDVCQEPQGRGEAGEPPLTVVLVRRGQAEAQTWVDLDLVELRRRSKSRPKLLSLVVTEPVAMTAEWQAAAPAS